jgi:hypothetical protein
MNGVSAVFDTILLLLFFSIFGLSLFRLLRERLQRDSVYQRYINAAAGATHPGLATEPWMQGSSRYLAVNHAYPHRPPPAPDSHSLDDPIVQTDATMI